MKWRLSLAALVLGSLASTAWAQTAIQPGTIVGSFYGYQYWNGANQVLVYISPADRAARVTDIVITNYHTASCKGSMSIGVNFLAFATTPGQSLVVPFSSGYGLTANQAIYLNGSDCPSMTLLVMVKGFNFTIP